jgi:hypothetical protein
MENDHQEGAERKAEEAAQRAEAAERRAKEAERKAEGAARRAEEAERRAQEAEPAPTAYEADGGIPDAAPEEAWGPDDGSTD